MLFIFNWNCERKVMLLIIILFVIVQYNQIGYTVGGWKIEDVTAAIKNLANINKIVVIGTNDVINVSSLV